MAGVRNAFAGLRIPLLENYAVLLGREGKRFWVAGIGDQVAHRVGRFRGVDDLPGTHQQITADDPVIARARAGHFSARASARRLDVCGPHAWRADPLAADLARFSAVETWQALCLLARCRTPPASDRVGWDRHQHHSGRLGVPPEIVHVTLGA